MKEKWYNKKLSIKYIYTIVAIIFIGTLFIPLQSIQCSKTDNVCFIYSRNVILRHPKLVNQFNISDIDRYEIKDKHNSGGRGGIRYCEKGLTASPRAMHVQSELIGMYNENVTGFDKIGYQRKDPIVSSFTEYIGIHGLSQTIDDKVGRIAM